MVISILFFFLLLLLELRHASQKKVATLSRFLFTTFFVTIVVSTQKGKDGNENQSRFPIE